MSETIDSPSGRGNYAAVMGTIGSGHALSHFFMLALPPLFPLLKAEFGVSYAALGLLITLFNLATSVTQIPAGFLVDHIGPKRVLVGGLLISGISFCLIGWAPDYWIMLVFVLFAGTANSVFHPANYSILNASIEAKRIGRAFALHTFSGNLGFVAAPTTMILLSSMWGWRMALVFTGLLAFIMVAILLRTGDLLKDSVVSAKGTEEEPFPGTKTTGIRPLLQPAIFSMFFFFVISAMVTSGIHSFLITALVQYQGLDLASASSVLTGFLVSGAVGVLIGGAIADRTTRHGLVTVSAIFVASLALLAVGVAQLSVSPLQLAFVLVGTLLGVGRPSRDMMVRAMTPEGASGRTFAFVSTGLNVGAAVTPVLFGHLIDIGQAQSVFYFMAGILVLAVPTVVLTRQSSGLAPVVVKIKD